VNRSALVKKDMSLSTIEQDIKYKHEQIEQNNRDSLFKSKEIGILINHVEDKNMFPPGMGKGQWVKQKLGISRYSAWNYQRIAKRWAEIAPFYEQGMTGKEALEILYQNDQESDTSEVEVVDPINNLEPPDRKLNDDQEQTKKPKKSSPKTTKSTSIPRQKEIPIIEDAYSFKDRVLHEPVPKSEDMFKVGNDIVEALVSELELPWKALESDEDA